MEFAATPLPLRGNVCGEPPALSVKLTLPVTLPAATGANCAVKDRLRPALIVAGSTSPVIPNPFPETAARFTMRSVFPLLVNWTVCVLVCPTVTFPKFNDAGETVMPGCVPVPVSEMLSGVFEASLATERLAVAAPEACGAN